MIPSLILFSDPQGIPQTLQHVPKDAIRAIVAAAIRPGQHAGVRTLAQNANSPVFIQPKPTDPAWPNFLASIQSLHPDLFFVNSYSMRLPPELLALAGQGGVNVHWSLLPQYRGCSPIQWSLIRGEHEAGVSLHRLSSDLDAGAVLAQKRIPAALDDTWVSLHDRLQTLSDTLLQEALPALWAGTLKALPQNPATASYFPRRTQDDGRFEWTQRVIDIYNLIRALVDPLPGAFVLEGAERRVLTRFHSLNEVTALKYNRSGRSLQRPAIHLVPILNDPLAAARTPIVPSANDAILFSLYRQPDNAWAGRGGLRQLNVSEKSAVLWVEPAPGGTASEALLKDAKELLTSFAADELGWSVRAQGTTHV